MDNLLTFAITVFTGFFAIMNPIANVPIFLSLVGDADEQTKKDINKKAVLTAFAIVVVFVILGKFIFEVFGITIPAFKITGGILVFFVGFNMLQSKKSNIKHIENYKIDENVAISPLAIPILAGPGTIVTAMNFITHSELLHIITVIIIFGIMCLFTYFAFSLSEFFVKKIGTNVIAVISKIMGLIIAIIGTDMIINGIKLAFSIK
ncbi:MAG: hypothetical protein CR986_00510 [Ignavibacteriae bacterium]|nr:MAG: hypothetical protein CR986_00510 [Ignavibacteriota bacterium]